LGVSVLLGQKGKKKKKRKAKKKKKKKKGKKKKKKRKLPSVVVPLCSPHTKRHTQ